MGINLKCVSRRLHRCIIISLLICGTCRSDQEENNKNCEHESQTEPKLNTSDSTLAGKNCTPPSDPKVASEQNTQVMAKSLEA